MGDVLALLAVRRDGSSAKECRFRVSIEGGSFKDAEGGEHPYVPLPSAPRPLRVTVLAEPTGKLADHFHTLIGNFEYNGPGALDATMAPPELRPLPGIVVGTGSATNLVAILSRIRDVTREALDVLAGPPAGWPLAEWPPSSGRPWPPDAWDTPTRADLPYVANPPVDGGAIRFDRGTVDPDTEDLVVEWMMPDDGAPRWLAVSWPKAIARTPGSGPVPFLVYLRAGTNQNAKLYNKGAYPASWAYVLNGLWAYVNYLVDPLVKSPGPKGLPYQVARSGKRAVLVLPMPRVGKEFGTLLSAANMQEMLAELAAFMYRRAGSYAAPEVGRTALAAFSSGSIHLTAFLAKSKSHPFLKNNVQEVYNFDGPDVSAFAEAAAAWLKTGAAADKRVRIYKHAPHAALLKLVGHALGAAPSLTTSADGQRSVGVFPNEDWYSAIGAIDKDAPDRFRLLWPDDWQLAHQAIAAFLLTDAMRRSGF
jgi:hypothetical protein